MLDTSLLLCHKLRDLNPQPSCSHREEREQGEFRLTGTLVNERELAWFSGELTHAVDAGVVEVVSKGTLAAERAVRVDAQAVPADARVLHALVHVCGGTRDVRTGIVGRKRALVDRV